MSFILNALRKSESQRHLGEPPRPGMPTPISRTTPRKRPLGWLVIVTLIALGVIAYYFDLHTKVGEYFSSSAPAEPMVADGQTQSLDTSDAQGQEATDESLPASTRSGPAGGQAGVESADQAAAETARSAQLEQMPKNEAEKPASTDLHAGEMHPPSPPQHPPATIQRQELGTTSSGPAIADRPQAAPGQSGTTGDMTNSADGQTDAVTQAAAPEPVNPGAVSALELPGDRVPHVTELPLAVRQSLPTLDLNVHVYDDDPGNRFVLINMVRYQEGDTVGGDVYLERINPDGIELRYRDARFRLTSSH